MRLRKLYEFYDDERMYSSAEAPVVTGNRRRRVLLASGNSSMIYGRQSTALIVTVGPVLDADGVAVTDGVVADFVASKNGAAPAALNGSATLTHRNTGHYSLSLTTTDTNTVGTLEIIINDTVNACPVKEIHVVEPVIYDALFADTANAFTGAAGSTKVTGVVLTDTLTTYTGNTVQTGDSFARLGAPAGASVSADIAAIEAQTDDIGAAGAGLTAITSKTDNLPTDPADESLVIAATDAIFNRLGAPAGASVSADIAAIEAQTDDIGVAGAGLTAIVPKKI